MGFVCRFDPPGRDKEFRPLVLFSSGSGGRLVWRWQSWDAPRPLYGLDRLAEQPSAPVVVCEGEKSADAVERLLPGHIAITSPNGAKSAAKADWSPLAGRSVTIWPDADEAGMGYADAVARLLFAAGAASVATISPPSGAPEKWDAADAEADGWTQVQVLALITSARPLAPPTVGAKARARGDDSDRPRRRRPPQRDSLMQLTEFCELWHDASGTAYITIPVNSHRENWPIRSDVFKRWLAARAYEQTGLVPGAQSVEDTLRVLEARACMDGPERTPWLRVGSAGGRHYVDLCDRSWRVVEISSDGWQVLDRHDAPFIRSGAMRALPEPEGGYSIDLLRGFVNTADEADFVLIVAWLVAALRSTGPYPILTINAEQGAGKSTLSRLVRSLCDPNAAPIRAAPRDDRDLLVTAVSGHAIVLDNISRIESWLSDALCRIATGGGFATRQLHTDNVEIVFQAQKPIILNGIPMLTERPDLADRAVTVRLRSISEDVRRPEDEFWLEWEAAAPRVLGALLDGVSAACRNLPTTKLDRAPRLADFAKWIVAAEPGLGFDQGTFTAAYSGNRKDTEEASFEADTVAVAIHKFVTTEYPESGWEGTASQLLDAINVLTSETVRRSRSWPQTAQALGNRLERVAPLLRARGLHVERRHSGVRTVRIAVVRPG